MCAPAATHPDAHPFFFSNGGGGGGGGGGCGGGRGGSGGGGDNGGSGGGGGGGDGNGGCDGGGGGHGVGGGDTGGGGGCGADGDGGPGPNTHVNRVRTGAPFQTASARAMLCTCCHIFNNSCNTKETPVSTGKVFYVQCVFVRTRSTARDTSRVRHTSCSPLCVCVPSGLMRTYIGIHVYVAISSSIMIHGAQTYLHTDLLAQRQCHVRHC
jgi:hypothetical protein